MSFLFEGSNDNLNSSATPPVTAYPFTVCVWYKRSGVTASAYMLWTSGEGAGADTNCFALTTTSTNDVTARANAGTNANSTTTGGSLDTNWHHAAGVFTSATSRTAYLDGVAATASSTNVTPSVTTWETRVGLRFDNTLDMLGYIAHVAIWDDVLSAGEIAGLAGGDNPATITPASGAALVAYWPMLVDESPVSDSIASFDLTVSGAAYSAENPTIDSSTTKYVKVLAESSAASETSLEVVVYSAPAGTNYVTGTTRYGSTNGQAFEATLEAGEAVLLVPAADVGCSSLAASTTVAALAQNATYTTGMVSATIVEV